MLGTFVTAKLFGKDDCRQGWVISTIPLIIQGQSGIHYHCSGKPVLVVNPPPNQALDSDTKRSYSGNPDNNPRKNIDIFHAPMF